MHGRAAPSFAGSWDRFEDAGAASAGMLLATAASDGTLNQAPVTENRSCGASASGQRIGFTGALVRDSAKAPAPGYPESKDAKEYNTLEGDEAESIRKINVTEARVWIDVLAASILHMVAGKKTTRCRISAAR